LIEAVRRLELPAVIATGELSNSVRRSLPDNVQAGPLSHTGFIRRTSQASVVVVPLRPDIQRSAGQQTYLNSMALGKLVIVTDSPGARDYLQDQETGLIVPPGNADAMADALDWALSVKNHRRVMAIQQRARQVVRENFTPLRYFESLLAVTQESMKRMSSDR